MCEKCEKLKTANKKLRESNSRWRLALNKAINDRDTLADDYETLFEGYSELDAVFNSILASQQSGGAALAGGVS